MALREDELCAFKEGIYEGDEGFGSSDGGGALEREEEKEDRRGLWIETKLEYKRRKNK